MGHLLVPAQIAPEGRDSARGRGQAAVLGMALCPEQRSVGGDPDVVEEMNPVAGLSGSASRFRRSGLHVSHDHDGLPRIGAARMSGYAAPSPGFGLSGRFAEAKQPSFDERRGYPLHHVKRLGFTDGNLILIL